MSGGCTARSPDLDEEESKIRDIQAAQRRLKEIDAQLRALQTPRVLLNSVGTKTTDSEQSVSNTPFGVLRTSDSFHSSISTLEQNPEASPVSPSHSPKSAAESPKTALASEDRSKEKANGSDAYVVTLHLSRTTSMIAAFARCVFKLASAHILGREMSPAKQLALRKEKRLQRERLKDIDKRLAQLRASDHNGDVTKNLLPREHIDCMVREMGQEYTVRLASRKPILLARLQVVVVRVSTNCFRRWSCMFVLTFSPTYLLAGRDSSCSCPH